MRGVRLVVVTFAAIWMAFILAASALTVQLTRSQAAPAPVPGGTGPSGFRAPVTGAVVTQAFGCTAYVFEAPQPACPSGHWHSGIDLAAPSGRPVRATLPGRVMVVHSAGGYGLHVVIDHGAGLSSLYGHLSEVLVPDGALVEAGASIGAVGSTGNSTGPHLHFEIRRDGIAEDPRLDAALP